MSTNIQFTFLLGNIVPVSEFKSSEKASSCELVNILNLTSNILENIKLTELVIPALKESIKLNIDKEIIFGDDYFTNSNSSSSSSSNSSSNSSSSDIMVLDKKDKPIPFTIHVPVPSVPVHVPKKICDFGNSCDIRDSNHVKEYHNGIEFEARSPSTSQSNKINQVSGVPVKISEHEHVQKPECKHGNKCNSTDLDHI